MSLEQVEIRVSNLALGMFVSQLDCPWSQTPFPLQGFLLRNPADINTLSTYCDKVYIDITKGRGPLKEGQKSHGPVSFKSKSEGVKIQPLKKGSLTKPIVAAKPIVVKRYIYTDVIPLKVEINQAERALKTLRGHLILATKQIIKGRDFDYPALKLSVDQMVDSVVRCPDAFTWLMRLRAKDQYSHDHAMRSALWATQFARFIGLPKEEITTLTLGVLLKDVGKVHIFANILKSQKRDDTQQKEYQQFIVHSVNMLKSRKVDSSVISVVRHHCEKNDGSGFPKGIGGNQIPLLARIAGISTIYDQISSPRSGGGALSPSKAISTLYNMRGKGFQDDLTVQFIQSVGLYPTGTLVEVTTGDIGVVVEQHPKSRLTPQLAIVSKPVVNKRHKDYLLVDLKDEEEARKKMISYGFARAGHVGKLAIARDLEFAGHDVDMAAVSSLFMRAVSDQLEQAVNGGDSVGLFSRLKQSFGRNF